jgi:molybdate transport system substrate-binding protein
LAVVFSLLFFLSGSPSLASRTLIAFVGSASLPATKEAGQVFEKETGIHIELHFGGSGSMLSQMILSRRGDLYFPGSPDYMAKAIEREAVNPDSVRDIAYLIPAINVPRTNPKIVKGLEDLGRDGIRLAIANPHSVAIGVYAAEIIDKSGFKESVKPNIKTYVESFSRLGNLIALNNIDAVIGWRILQQWNPDRALTILLKPREIPRISTAPIAISQFTRNPEAARQFIRLLESDAGKGIFRKWGYIVTETEARSFAPKARIGGRYEVPSDW